ncbi:Protein kinase C-like [Dissostichus eleginoides]|uniref:Protein kinase C-like n=1 Tax=Dissostichus eleginoides TaxID=100907 RepID=A0AAD9CAQ5_DISEL|nr:Protein kinase C-like [Dissostichus eleginoides]
MGNEASMEGGGQPGEPGAAVMMGSAMPGGPATGPGAGQHMKPVNGTAAGGGMGVGGPGMGMTRLWFVSCAVIVFPPSSISGCALAYFLEWDVSLTAD